MSSPSCFIASMASFVAVLKYMLVPADLILTPSACSVLFISFLNSASAMGLLHALPEHRKSTFCGFIFLVSC